MELSGDIDLLYRHDLVVFNSASFDDLLSAAYRMYLASLLVDAEAHEGALMYLHLVLHTLVVAEIDQVVRVDDKDHTPTWKWDKLIDFVILR